MHLNRLRKIELRMGPGPLVVNVIVNYCCKRELLKQTETEETIGFFVTFLSWVTFQLGRGRFWASLATPMVLNETLRK